MRNLTSVASADRVSVTAAPIGGSAEISGRLTVTQTEIVVDES